jgi:hypothetical protein
MHFENLYNEVMFSWSYAFSCTRITLYRLLGLYSPFLNEATSMLSMTVSYAFKFLWPASSFTVGLFDSLLPLFWKITSSVSCRRQIGDKFFPELLIRTSICIYIYLRRVDHSSKESYRLCKKGNGTEEEARAQQRAVEPLMNEWMNEIYTSKSSFTV